MISLVSDDFKGPVHLFQQDNSHHLVWESHFGEGQLEVSSLADRRRKSQAAADNKDHIAMAVDT